MWKKIIGITSIILLLFVAFAAAVPWLFKDKLKAIAKNQLNEQINANAGFRDVSISLFRDFPRVSVGLEEFFIAGKESFSADTLVSANRISISVNLFSLFGNKALEIKELSLDAPRIHAIVDQSGKTNWDIMKKEDTVSTPENNGSFALKLSKYKIQDGYLAYDDEQSNMHLVLQQLNHEGSGNFNDNNFQLATTSDIGSVNFNYGGIPYLVKTKIGLDAAIDIDNKISKYSFSKATARLNALEIAANGYFQFLNDSTYAMDIGFNTPSSDFKDILSLVPAVYQNEFSSVQTKGTAAFNGFIKGNYSPVSIPAYNLNLNIKDGFFKYPDLPQPVQDINLSLKASNPDGAPDHTVIEIPAATLKFGNEPFQLRLLYKQPLTAQYIDAGAKGKLDLATIGQFIKLETGTKIGGQINADLTAKGNLNVVLQQKPGPFEAKGFLELTNILYASNEFPQPIKNTSAAIHVTNNDGTPDNTVIDITHGHAEMGPDKIDFNLLLTHPATDPDFNATVKGGLELDRIKQWYSFPSGTKLGGHVDADLRVVGKKSMFDQKKYTQAQVSGQLLVNDLVYESKEYSDPIQLKNAQFDFTNREINMSQAKGIFQQTGFSATGKITNAIGYLMSDEPLTGNLKLNTDHINLNKWLGTPGSTDTTGNAQSQPFAVPANIRFNLDFEAEDLVYDKVKYEQVKGIVAIADQSVTLQNLQMNALGGNIGLNGSYSTRLSKSKPAINLGYTLNNLDVAQAFKAFNTIKYLIPVGEFISGKLNSSLQMNGRLGESMMPDLQSLVGNGSVLLVEGFLSKFKPLDALAENLKITGFEKISVKDIKQYFEFVNGKVLVKPFKLQVSDINMEIGGMHGFDQSLDYVINMKIPRAKMGNQANAVINGLAAELSKKGLPVTLGETVNLKVNMGGTITKPIISYSLQQASTNLANEMEGKLKNLAAEQKAKADSILAENKKAAQDSLDIIKKMAMKEAEDMIKRQLTGVKDSANSGGSGLTTPKKAEEAAKGLLDNLLKKKKKAPDSTGQKL